MIKIQPMKSERKSAGENSGKVFFFLLLERKTRQETFPLFFFLLFHSMLFCEDVMPGAPAAIL